MQAFRTCGGSFDSSNFQSLIDEIFNSTSAEDLEETDKTTKTESKYIGMKDAGRRSGLPRAPPMSPCSSTKASSVTGGDAENHFLGESFSPSELVRLSDGSEDELEDDDEGAVAIDTKAEKWVRKIKSTRGNSPRGHNYRKASGSQASSSSIAGSTTSSVRTVKTNLPAVRVFKGMHTPDNQCKIEVKSTQLSGSPNSEFRDAHVTFEEDQIIVDVVDNKGRTWKLKSTLFPGAGINTSESRYNLDAAGKDMSITLTKADTLATWDENEGHMVLLKPEEAVLRRCEGDAAAGFSAPPPEPVKTRSAQASSLGASFM